jgi:hypothetical protein
MRIRFFAMVVTASLVVMSTTGCTNIIDALKPAPTINRIKVAAKVGKPGAAVQGKLKTGYPAELPFWEGSGVMKNKVVKSSSGKSWQATLATHDPYSDVLPGMAKGLQDSGWQVESQDLSSDSASTTVLTVTGQSAAGVITISAEPGKMTQIDYVITSSK